jgi:hypothetical protein
VGAAEGRATKRGKGGMGKKEMKVRIVVVGVGGGCCGPVSSSQGLGRVV